MRLLVLRELDRRLGFLPYERRISLGSIERPEYGHGLCHAARLAAKLGHDRISVIEFGVAGGNGLVALEKHAHLAGTKYGVGIDVFGFDNATGMPPPAASHREMLYLFREGYFAMDEAALRARLRRAELVLGRIEETLPAFILRDDLAPIGFIAFDVDYYSSMLAALKVLETPMTKLLPRVVCYMDDTVGDVDTACNRHTGMLAAIGTFNQSHADVKVEPVAGLRYLWGRIPHLWHEQMYVAHLFRHRQYGQLITNVTRLPLKQ